MLTKGAIGNLVNRYRAVLKKCNLINAFGSLAVASMLVLGGAGVASAASNIELDDKTAVQNVTKNETFHAGQDHSSNSWESIYKIKKGTLNITGTENTHIIFSDNKGRTGSTIITYPNDDSHAYITYATFKNNSATNDGGAIGNYGGMTITNSIFENNKAKTSTEIDQLTIGGGAISLGAVSKSKIASISNTIFKNNESGSYGGAIGTRMTHYDYNDAPSKDANGNDVFKTINDNSAATLDINATFIGNKATLSGGAIYNNFYANNGLGKGDGVTVTGVFESNHAGVSGGAIYNNGSVVFTGNDSTKKLKIDLEDSKKAIMTITNGIFTKNSSNVDGGAIFNSGTLTINGGSFEENIAGSVGGAIATSTKSLNTVINNTIFKNNHAVYDGGAIGNYNAMTITNCLFEGNTAQFTKESNWTTPSEDSQHIGGGAISLGSESATSISSISGSTFKYNKSGTNGGAIATRRVADGSVTLANLSIAATFIGNTAVQNGGAIYNSFTNNVSVTGTFTDNSAAQGGAIYNDDTGVMTVKDSTFSGNKLADGTLNDIHNEGTLHIEGSVTFDGGVTGDGEMKLDNAKIVLDNADAEFTNDVTGTASVSGSGKFNDQGGTLADLEAAFGDADVTATGIAEGLIAGAVDANGNRKVNTVMQDTLELATAAPLAVGRIVMNDVRKRMGDLRSAPGEAGVWMRWDGGKLKGDAGLTNDFNTIQVGGDHKVGKNCRFGVAAAFTHGDLDHSNGNGEMETYSFSAYSTWMGDNGMFADVIARVGFTKSEISMKGQTIDLDNEALSLSAEYGWRFDLCKQFYVEPQVELTYTYLTEADSEVSYATYKTDSVDSLIGRAGLAAGWKLPNEMGDIYARASVVQEFLGDTRITGSAFGRSVPHSLDGQDTWLEYGIGANIKLTDKTYIWADVERTEGADIDEEWRGTVGIRVSF